MFAFYELSFFHQVFCDGIECCVDVFPALRGAIHLGYFDVFIDADADGYVGECGYFCQSELKYDAVHQGDSVGVPSACV